MSPYRHLARFGILTMLLCRAIAPLSAQSLPFSESPLFPVNTAAVRLDTDADGMPDSYETSVGLDPQTDDANLDTDHDGLTNLEEYNAGTDPHAFDPKTAAAAESALFTVSTEIYRPDADADGIPDSWELAHGLDSARSDAAEDPDQDGLTNLQEYNAGTDPRSPDDPTPSSALSPIFALNTSVYPAPVATDSDLDGMPDWWEQKYGLDPLRSDADADRDNDGVSNLAEYQRGRDPNRDESLLDVAATSPLFTLDTVAAPPDTDGDGMRDNWELAMGLNPNRPDADEDPDRDGRTNLDEYNAGTNPLVDDWRGPSSAVSALFVVDTGGFGSALTRDSDADGLPDWWEILRGLDPNHNDALADPDGDGRTNLQEYNAGTDPRSPDNPDTVFGVSGIFLVDTGGKLFDTDADGLPDWWEKLYFNDPRSAGALSDADGDGAGNLAEFLAGTDPLDPTSAFRILSLATVCHPDETQVFLRWTVYQPSLYSVWTGPTPSGPFTLQVSNLPATAPAGSWVGTLPATNGFILVRLDAKTGP